MAFPENLSYVGRATRQRHRLRGAEGRRETPTSSRDASVSNVAEVAMYSYSHMLS